MRPGRTIGWVTASSTSPQDVVVASARRPSPPEWLMLLVPAVVLVVMRLHAFAAPLETDECNYAYIGSRLLAGDALYVDVWDHQPPGVFVLFAAVITVFGDSETAFRWLATGFALVPMMLVWGCCRRALGRWPGWFAALLFAIAASDPGTAGEGCNREVYMNALAVAAVALLLRPAPTASGDRPLSRALWGVFLAGLLLGIASTFKTVAAAQWLLLALALAWIRWGVEGRSLRHVTAAIGAFALGPALLWGLLFAYYTATDRLSIFWDAVFAYNVGYSGIESGLLGRFGEFFVRWRVFRTALPLWLAGAAGLVALLALRHRDRRWTAITLALTVGSYLAVCLPGRFWPHYYLLMLPPLAMLAGAPLSWLMGRRARCGPPEAGASYGSAAYAAVLFAGLLTTQALYYLLVPADFIASPRYGPRMVWARDQGRRLASVTGPDDRVFVWGVADAGMYYYSNRRCASRFTMIGGLRGEGRQVEVRRAQLIEDLTRTRPRVIIVARQPFAALRRFFVDHHYVSVGRDADRMEVLCDLDRLIPSIDWTWTPPSWDDLEP
jgi:hypothetical protein